MSAAQPSIRSEAHSCNAHSRIPDDTPRTRPKHSLGRPISILGARWLPIARIWFPGAIFALLMGVSAPARAQVIDTIAGGFNGSASPSENACAPVYGAGTHGTDVYVTSCDQIFKVNAAGQWTHVAGNGISGFSPDGTLAASASLGFPDHLSVDASGNIYFVDDFNNRVREIISSSGKLITVAGTGIPGYSGDTGLATNAQIGCGTGNSCGLFVDGHGNVFIGDALNRRVREVVAATGIINTVAGNGTGGSSGDGGPATAAQLRGPRGVFVDGSGNIFIADRANNKIREVLAATGDIQTVAGTGIAGFSPDGTLATSAELNGPIGVFLDNAGDMFIADQGNNLIREVVGGPGGNIKTVAGSGGGFPISCNGDINACLGVGGPATNALVPGPQEVVLDSSGNMFIPIVLDTRNVVEEVVAATGKLQIFAANGAQNFTGNNGPATKAQLNAPSFAATDGSGNVFIADATNNVIYEVVAATGIIKIVAGNGIAGYSGDGGLATSAELSSPSSVFADSSGNLFIADSINNVIRKVVAATGVIETVAGTLNPSCTYSGDGGPATSAGLCFPAAAVVDSLGNIIISDQGDSVIREVTAATGIINTVAGNFNLGGGYSGDGGPATSASLNGPYGVFVDGSGNLFFADNGNNVIREVVAATGNIQTAAGNGTQGFSGDGGPATSAEFNSPIWVWGDTSGNLYVSDGFNDVIRAFPVGGDIQTIAGDRVDGTSGDGGPAKIAELATPAGLFVEPSGSLLITGPNDGRVRIVGAATATALASSSNPSFLDQNVTFTATVTPAFGSGPLGRVNFLDNGSVIGTGSVNGNGQATFTTSTLATGGHPITAQYFGTNFPGSISFPLVQKVDVISATLTVSPGQTYTFVNANVPGNIVMDGGTLVLDNTTVGGNLTMTGGNLTGTNITVQGSLQITGGTFSIDPSHIKGNLLIHNIRVGSARNKICGTTVNGKLQFQYNGTAVMIGSPSCAGNTVGGNLEVSDNVAATQIYGNAVRGNLQVSSNSAATQVDNNKVTEDLLIQNNTASTGVFSNLIKHKLECSGNTPSLITGGGNKAEQMQGQCAKF
jgi:hypothetical protein